MYLLRLKTRLRLVALGPAWALQLLNVIDDLLRPLLRLGADLLPLRIPPQLLVPARVLAAAFGETTLHGTRRIFAPPALRAPSLRRVLGHLALLLHLQAFVGRATLRLAAIALVHRHIALLVPALLRLVLLLGV